MENINIPRPEHPTPDLVRENWVNLNGIWDFEIDNSKVGLEKKFYERAELSSKIMVPFCPESELSLVNNKDFMNAVWYRRSIRIPEEWAGKRVILHIGACDYETKIFVNGNHMENGDHKGGYTPIACDITEYLTSENNNLVIYAQDDTRSNNQPSGKQSKLLNSHGCYYTRTTGIWQTVWMEAVEDAHITNYNSISNIENGTVTLEVDTENAIGATLTVKASFNGENMGEAHTRVNSNKQNIVISLKEKHLWDIGVGNLYDLEFSLEKGGKLDTVKGYFGLREVGLSRSGFVLNGRKVFLKTVLDQGFYPDGIYTAKTKEDLKFDIEAGMKAGFNGARLHQKVFEPLYLYYADKLGYMVVDETPNWGMDHTDPMNIYNFLPQWIEEIERDKKHPSVVLWTPFNETWDRDGRRQSNDFINLIYLATKAEDSTRPVFSNSGSFPCMNDVHDVHDYNQDTEAFKESYAHIDEGIVCCQLYRKYKDRTHYDTNKPVFVSEYGGIGWVGGAGGREKAWSYGKSVGSEEEFFDRLEKLTDVLRSNKDIIGFCYTQLTDVEQEQNGVLTYDRKFKFAPEKFAEIFSKKSVVDD